MTEPKRGTDADPSSSKGELKKFFKDKKKSKEPPMLAWRTGEIWESHIQSEYPRSSGDVYPYYR
jgi:hypothetical protein